MKKLIISSLILSSASLNAAFSLSVSIGALYTSTVGVDAPGQVSGQGGAIGLLVVDTLDTGSFPQGADLYGKGLTLGSNWGNGHYVMTLMTAVPVTNIGGTGSNQDVSGGTVIAFNGNYSAINIDLASATYGNANAAIPHNFAMYWFPSITDVNPTAALSAVTPSIASIPLSPVSPISYGFYTNSSAPNTTITAANKAFVTPTATETLRITQEIESTRLNSSHR